MTRSNAERPKARKFRAISTLRVEESAEVLCELLREHPAISSEADAIAKRMLAEADYEEIASEVEDAVLEPELDELNSRAGRTRWGYVDPADAAWELMNEAVEPFLDELRRCIKLGMREGAIATCQGIVLGLYRCRGRHPDHVVEWAPDFVEQTATETVAILTREQLGKTRGSSRFPEAFIREIPEWADLINRAEKPARNP